MRTDKDGGRAFPAPARYDSELGMWDCESHFVGMSMRDYFAAKAMQGLLSQSMGTALGSDPADAALYAYAVADAMIIERGKEAA